jgi:ISXO2-like transposase domain
MVQSKWDFIFEKNPIQQRETWKQYSARIAELKESHSDNPVAVEGAYTRYQRRKKRDKEQYKTENITTDKRHGEPFNWREWADHIIKKQELKEKSSFQQNTASINFKTDSEYIIVSDSYKAYRGVEKMRKHVMVKGDGGYVQNGFHTNNIENFWSLLKRGIIGIYHFTSAKHLQKYCDEFAFRYNFRNSTTSARFNLVFGSMENRLTYKQLIA